jgi:catechol 2,3-dioxygenase-like lactoylglutathione lyase family enzyme
MPENRAVVDGIGGIFIYANDAKALADWYTAHLGIPIVTYEEGKNFGTEFKYTNLDDPTRTDSTVYSIQASPTPLAKERNQAVVNYRVRDLSALLRQLRAANIEIEKEVDYDDYGRFAWIRDPEGNKIELYQPVG